MESDKLRVGVIGANPTYGWAQRAHLPALVALPNIELVAVCTTRGGAAKDSAEKFGAAMAFSDHRTKLREAELDAVAVSVKVPLHYRLTMDVLRPVSTSIPSGHSEPTSVGRGAGQGRSG